MKNKLLILSVLQSIYIMYILNDFKTRYSFAHPLLDFSSSYFKHPIGINNTPISNICNFGHESSFYLAMFVIFRTIFIKKKYCKKISIIVLIITFLVSLLNFNAVIYLIPHFLIEIYLIKYIF
tara:strand:+ start:1877 stop:2245 length:369 start_codon:yes stop_codon:yes gene_type:complete